MLRTTIVLGSIAGAVCIQAAFIACSSTKLLGASTPDARAQTVGGTLDVATEACSTTVADPTSSGATVTFAAHAYPGLTAAQLSQVRVIGHLASPGRVPGYPWQQGSPVPGPAVQDGSVAVICAVGINGMTITYYDSVTFTLVK
jgi:hypothetical protein